VNLRAVSSSRTVVVFNGRRFPEQYSASVGRFNNVALIPNAAIGRVEVLKDGGATTYGADAVGGVVNYITRRNLDGIETNANYRYIDDSDGDWDADISVGKVESNWNVMAVAGYMHRSALRNEDRSFALQDYLINPSSWNGSGSPGAYTFQRLAAGTQQSITPVATAASGNRYAGDHQMGAPASCATRLLGAGRLPGLQRDAVAGLLLPVQHPVEPVEETDTVQAYGEVNYKSPTPPSCTSRAALLPRRPAHAARRLHRRAAELPADAGLGDWRDPVVGSSAALRWPAQPGGAPAAELDPQRQRHAGVRRPQHARHPGVPDRQRRPRRAEHRHLAALSATAATRLRLDEQENKSLT
jgi:hypothetical protein